jgi:putative flavoprotein involved in K+ transport
VPQIAQGLSRSIDQVTPRKYRSPERLRSGNVLVVGAAATGVQIAQELRLAGREVILAVGQHVRVPRAYRGRDILWWLDRMGVFDETDRDVFDVEISRDQSSFQLVGRDDHATIDLGILQDLGVHIVGRLRHLDRHRASFADDLVVSAVAADVKLASLLKRIDAFVATNRLDVPAAPPFEPLWPRMTRPAVTLNLRERGITSVVWATGFRRAYPWLRVPGALDRHGEIRHRHGVCEIPGLYVLGLPFLRHRNSAFIDGVGRDAMSLADHLRRYLDERRVA